MNDHQPEHALHPHEHHREDPVPVVLINDVDYTNTLRYIAVMLTVIGICLVFEGIKAWL